VRDGTLGQSRRMLVTAGITGGLTMLAGTASASAGPGTGREATAGRPVRERRNRAAVIRAFERHNAGGDVFEILHDDVEWTIVNGRTYTSKAEFLTEGAAPVRNRLASTLVKTIQDVRSDGDTVIIRFQGDATATDGLAYHNEYCWVWQLRAGRVVRSHAYLDMIAVRDLVDRIPIG
jgi:uncharacterized protein